MVAKLKLRQFSILKAILVEKRLILNEEAEIIRAIEIENELLTQTTMTSQTPTQLIGETSFHFQKDKEKLHQISNGHHLSFWSLNQVKMYMN